MCLQKINSLKVKRLDYWAVISLDNLEQGLYRTIEYTSSTKAKFTKNQLIKLHKDLKRQKYSPKTFLKQSHTTFTERNRPISNKKNVTASLVRDKIVQAALKIQLEHLLENHFSTRSFGSRFNNNAHHDVFQEIKYKWKNVNWVIKMCIQKDFKTTNHEILFAKLNYLVDQATLELIRKIVKSNSVTIFSLTQKPLFLQTGNVPDDSLLSPVLTNIYFHDFDVFVQKTLLENYNCTSKKKKSYFTSTVEQFKEPKNINSTYNTERSPSSGAQTFSDSVCKTACKALPIKSLFYIRYADSFLFALKGTKQNANDVRHKIEHFLLTKLGLKLVVGTEKSCIIHSESQNIFFLGVYIRYINSRLFWKTVTKNKPIRQKTFTSDRSVTRRGGLCRKTQLLIPVDYLLRDAAWQRYGKRKINSIRPTSCRHLTNFSETFIIQHFSNIIRNLVSYYACANQRSDLWSLVSFYKKSCALTLADKLKLRTAAQVFKKYGSRLIFKDEQRNSIVMLYYPNCLKTKIKFKKT